MKDQPTHSDNTKPAGEITDVNEPPERKPFVSPRLERVGDLKELTQQFGGRYRNSPELLTALRTADSR
jgi:hypothetical protein